MKLVIEARLIDDVSQSTPVQLGDDRSGAHHRPPCANMTCATYP